MNKSVIELKLNDVLVFKKGHPCGANAWKIVRLGVDLKLECLGCERIVMMPRIEARRKCKKIMTVSEYDIKLK